MLAESVERTDLGLPWAPLRLLPGVVVDILLAWLPRESFPLGGVNAPAKQVGKREAFRLGVEPTRGGKESKLPWRGPFGGVLVEARVVERGLRFAGLRRVAAAVQGKRAGGTRGVKRFGVSWLGIESTTLSRRIKDNFFLFEPLSTRARHSTTPEKRKEKMQGHETL